MSQREQTLRRVYELLEDYREALRSSKPRSVQDTGDEVVTVYYRMNAAIASDLFKYLPQLVAPESWNADAADGGTIVRLASKPSFEPAGKEAVKQPIEQATLVIRQKRRIHEEIAELIRRVENGDELRSSPAFSGGGGLGGGGGGSFGGGIGGGTFSVPDSAD